MDFPGLFGEHILSESIHSLNVSFLVNSLKRARGGTAPNISYNLALVGLKPSIVGTAGRDFGEYRQWLESKGVDTSNIRILEDDFTASCFITTDKASNQITVFYPGAMAKDPEISMKNLDLSDVSMVIVAPTEPEAMMKWARECSELKVPYMFDPGMQIPRLSAEQLAEGIMGSTITIMNEYEFMMMKEKTGLDKKDILEKVELFVETKGSKGSILSTRNTEVHIPAAKASRVADPTGAGDAFRAGLIKGYMEGAPLEITGKYASVTAVYAVEHKGGTEHYYTIDEFYKRYNENFGSI